MSNSKKPAARGHDGLSDALLLAGSEQLNRSPHNASNQPQRCNHARVFRIVEAARRCAGAAVGADPQTSQALLRATTKYLGLALGEAGGAQ
jgi:hypothetical protein